MDLDAQQFNNFLNVCGLHDTESHTHDNYISIRFTDKIKRERTDYIVVTRRKMIFRWSCGVTTLCRKKLNSGELR